MFPMNNRAAPHDDVMCDLLNLGWIQPSTDLAASEGQHLARGRAIAFRMQTVRL
jgi:hypothetical protein